LFEESFYIDSLFCDVTSSLASFLTEKMFGGKEKRYVSYHSITEVFLRVRIDKISVSIRVH